MQDFFGSVHQSLVFRSTSGENEGGGIGGFVGKIGSSIRKSKIGLFSKLQVPALSLPIRWRKGELIGCGAFGRVYMGMNLDSGELLVVKHVLIAASSVSKEKAQAHIRELEEEVKLLKNLSHQNIVRYLGTARENDSLNILLEFVPGESISSILGKVGSFPESVIRVYTKQLLLGLEYLHRNGVMHTDIKGANILVDNEGCIKLADFGASKKVVELATMNGAKSMKGTAYWMAPEVIRQTGHSFSADIWSVGCTVIEMVTGKPPWSQQFEEVAALIHIGRTQSHPPIPEHLSIQAKDFLLKCFQKEPNFRFTAANLLEHPFVTGKYQGSHPLFRNSVTESRNPMASGMNLKNSMNFSIRRSACTDLKDVCEMGSVRCSTVYPEHSTAGSYWKAGRYDNMDDFGVSTSVKLTVLTPADLNKSFSPMCEPTDYWPCKFDGSLEVERNQMNESSGKATIEAAGTAGISCNGVNYNFSFPCGSSAAEDDDDVTESKIRAFLDEKALDLKKLQSPLYKEFYSTLHITGYPSTVGTTNGEDLSNLPPKSRSSKWLPSRRLSAAVGGASGACSGRQTGHISNMNNIQDGVSQEIQQPHHNELEELLVHAHKETIVPSLSFSEMQRKWKQELDEELQRKREMMCKASGGSRKTSSPRDHILIRQRQR